jgi:hypothetical protein
VLSLLQEEFPDVTISKIRFLESQGLVDPERTPSGYRKFYEPDIDRLRWVLRQQRDAFLPLKVIKGRLDGQGELIFDEEEDLGGIGDDANLDGDDQAPVQGGGDAMGGVRPGGGPAVPATAKLGTRSPGAPGPATPGPVTSQPGTGGPGGGAARAAKPAPVAPAAPAAASAAANAAAGTTSAGTRAAGTTSAGTRAAGTTAAGTTSAGTTAAGTTAAGTANGSGGRPTGGGRVAEERRVERRAVATPETSGPGTPRRSGAPGPSAPTAPGGRASSPSVAAKPAGLRGGRAAGDNAGAAGAGEDDVSLDELVSAPDIEVETVKDLERFGLITPKLVGSVPYYSHDAAAIVHLASAFARHGVEARHLRAYKGAAEREAGMVQQVIMPLMRQRNPEAREAAARAVEELSQLGGELRAALLRSALSDLR